MTLQKKAKNLLIKKEIFIFYRRFSAALGGFKRNVLILMVGSVFAQGIAVASAPIITRLYTPWQFGIYGLFVSSISILSVLVCLCYELAIVLPEQDEDAQNLVLISILIAIGTSVISFLVVAQFKHFIADLLGVPELVGYLWLMPISLMVAGLYGTLNYWSTRKCKYKLLAKSRVSSYLGAATCQIGFGSTLSIGPGGLIGGHVVGQIIGVAVLASKFKMIRKKAILFSNDSLKRIYNVLNKYRKFPLILSWSSLLDITSQQMPIFFVTHFFGPSTAGLYNLAYRVIMIPSILIGNAVTQVYFQEASSRLHSTGTLAPIVESVSARLFQIICIPVLIFSIASPTLFSFVFGDAWREAGQFVQILAPAIGIQFIISPLSMTLLTLELQHILARWQILYFVVQGLIMLICGLYLDVLGFMICLSFGSIVLYTLYGYLIFKYSGARFSSALRTAFSFKGVF